MPYRSPFNNGLLPATAHLDDELTEFTATSLETLKQRGITDVLAGTEVEFVLRYAQDASWYDSAPLRAHWKDTLTPHIKKKYAQDAPKLREADTFRSPEYFMARLHELSPLRPYIIHDFGRSYYDNPNTNEIRTKPMPVEELPDVHNTILRVLDRRAHASGVQAQFRGRHLTFSAKKDGRCLFDPDSPDYWGIGAKTSGAQVQAVFDSLVFLERSSAAERANFHPGCGASRMAPIRVLDGRSEFRYHLKCLEADHLRLMVALQVVVPLLAATDASLLISEIPQKEKPQFRGSFYAESDELRSKFSQTLSVLSGGAFQQKTKGEYIFSPPVAYIRAQEKQALISEELGLSGFNEEQRVSQLTAFFGGIKVDKNHVLQWPMAISYTAVPDDLRRSVKLAAIKPMHSLVSKNRYGEGLPEQAGPEAIAAHYAKRFAESRLFKQTLGEALHGTLSEAAITAVAHNEKIATEIKAQRLR